ncbi:MAG: ABC transporter permease [Thermoleophilia bacterium]|nr:ABC transporter permease [Thermoleophilia bacterium]
MLRVILRRLGWVLVTLAAVATFTFFLTFLLPQDVARTIAGDKVSEAEVERVRQELGLNDSPAIQYVRYMGRVARLDFGYSFVNRQPVGEIIAERLPRTISLAAVAIIFQLVVGIGLGLATAARANGVLDRTTLSWAVLMISLPTFWLGLILLYVFAFELGWFPLGGADSFSAIVLPAITLGIAGAAWYSRVVRQAASETLASDFVKELRAKGLPRRTILFKHVLRASLSPVLTMMAIDFGFFLGGAVLVETVYAWPGLGLTSYQAIETGDTPLLMACVIVGSAFVLILNLAADLVRTVIDPRVRLG